MKSLNNEDRVENDNAKDEESLFVIESMGKEACREKSDTMQRSLVQL